MKKSPSTTDSFAFATDDLWQPSVGGPQPRLSSKRLRFGISILIIGHLLAIFLPPLAFQANGPLGRSPSVSDLLRPLHGYAQFLYLDRGYAFFAPDPGPSHLIQAAITQSDGQRSEVLFPDLQQQWPRLMYHRHFMLAEYLNEIYQRPGPPAELVQADAAAANQWGRLRARYELVRQSMRDHLQHIHEDKFVQIRRIEHLIPSFIDFAQEPTALNDRRAYIVLLDQPLDASAGPPETIPPPTESNSPPEPLAAPLSIEAPGSMKAGQGGVVAEDPR